MGQNEGEKREEWRNGGLRRRRRRPHKHFWHSLRVPRAVEKTDIADEGEREQGSAQLGVGLGAEGEEGKQGVVGGAGGNVSATRAKVEVVRR